MVRTLQTIESFWSIEEAQLARVFLEGEGIACELQGLSTSGNLWYLSNATGGVKLLTAPEDAPRARELLQSVVHLDDDSSLESDEDLIAAQRESSPEEIPLPGDEPDTDEHETPDGESHGILETFRKRKRLLILLWLFSPVIFFSIVMLPPFMSGPIAAVIVFVLGSVLLQGATDAELGLDYVPAAGPRGQTSPPARFAPTLDDIRFTIVRYRRLLSVIAIVILLIVFAMWAPL